MDRQSDAITECIEDPATKKKVADFLERELPAFASSLDRFAKDISADGVCVKHEYCQYLKNIVNAVVLRAEEATHNVDKKTAQLIQKYFRELRPQFYYASEIVRKGLEKPRGYPGDFEMMNYVYNCALCSDTLMGKYWDHYLLNDGYSQAVRGRKNKMVELLKVVADQHKGKILRILNLPCGPARDVQEFLSLEGLRKDISIEIVCVDQDEEALAFGKQSVTNASPNVKVSFAKGNILSFIRHPEKHSTELGKFDFIYSIGLADYLPDKLLQSMISFTWSLLEVNGKLTYAFKIHDRDTAAPLSPKWFCDWVFVSRNLTEAKSMLQGLNDSQAEDLAWEESGRVAFFTVGKSK